MGDEEPKIRMDWYLGEPIAAYILDRYPSTAKNEGPLGAVEFFKVFFEIDPPGPGIDEKIWLALARAQLDRPPVLTEVRDRALAAAEKVFETAGWKDELEFENHRHQQIDKLKKELMAVDTIVETLEESKLARVRLRSHGQAGRLEKGLNLSREARKRWPEDKNFSLMEAQFLAFLDHPGEALDICREALRDPLDDPTGFAFLQLLGRLHIFLEQRLRSENGQQGLEVNLALKYLKEAQKLFPGEPETLRLLASAQILAGNPKAALENLDFLLQQEPEDSWLWKQRGVALEDQGLRKEAGDAYYKSVFYGGDAESLARQAWILMRQRRHEDAERCFMRAVEQAPQYTWALRGRILNKLSQRPGLDGWMVRHEIFWFGREMWRTATYVGSWLFVIGLVLFWLKNDDSLLWVPLGGGGAVMLAGLYLSGIWTWVLRRRQEKREGLEIEKSPKNKIKGRDLIAMGIGILIALVFMFLQKAGIVHKGHTPMEDMSPLLAMFFPFVPWAVVLSVLSNRRQKWSDIPRSDLFLLTLLSIFSSCLSPFFLTVGSTERWVVISGVSGIAGLLMIAGIYYLRSGFRKRKPSKKK